MRSFWGAGQHVTGMWAGPYFYNGTTSPSLQWAPVGENLDRSIAIGPDGTVYVGDADGNSNVEYFDAINGETGATISQTPLPSTTYTYSGAGVCSTNSYSYTTGSYSGPPVVVSDGSVYMQVESSQIAFAASGPDCSEDVNNIQSYTESLQMVHLASGSAQFQTLGTHSLADWIAAASPPYEGPFYGPGDVIPDGQGGVLADWSNYQENDGAALTLADISSSGITQRNYSNLDGELFGPNVGARSGDGDLVLGDNNTAFVTDGVHVAAFIPNSLFQLWNYTSIGSDLSLVAANPGGSVTIDDSQQGITQLSPFGYATSTDADRAGAAPFDLSSWQALVGGELTIRLDPDGADGIANVLALSPFPEPAGGQQSQKAPPACQVNGSLCALVPTSDIPVALVPQTLRSGRQVTYSVFGIDPGTSTLVPLWNKARAAYRISFKESFAPQSQDTSANICTDFRAPKCSLVNQFEDVYSEHNINELLSVNQNWYVNNQPVQVFWMRPFQGSVNYWYGSPNSTALAQGAPSQTVNIITDTDGKAHVHIYPNQTDEQHYLYCPACLQTVP